MSMHNGMEPGWVCPPYWTENYPRIQEACRRSGGTHDAADVLRQLNTDSFTFWKGTPSGFLIGEVIAYPRKRILRCWLTGGTPESVMGMVDDFKGLARAAGCQEMLALSRPGWEKFAPEWRKTGVILRLSLEG